MHALQLEAKLEGRQLRVAELEAGVDAHEKAKEAAVVECEGLNLKVQQLSNENEELIQQVDRSTVTAVFPGCSLFILFGFVHLQLHSLLFSSDAGEYIVLDR